MVGRLIIIMEAPSRLVVKQHSLITQHHLVGQFLMSTTSHLERVQQPHSVVMKHLKEVGRFIITMMLISHLMERQHSLATQQALVVRFIIVVAPSHLVIRQHSQTTR